MGKGERPQAEVRRRVADHAEHELDRFDGLVDDDFAEVVLLVPPPFPLVPSVFERREFNRRVVDELFLV